MLKRENILRDWEREDIYRDMELVRYTLFGILSLIQLRWNSIFNLGIMITLATLSLNQGFLIKSILKNNIRPNMDQNKLFQL